MQCTNIDISITYVDKMYIFFYLFKQIFTYKIIVSISFKTQEKSISYKIFLQKGELVTSVHKRNIVDSACFF